jgi:hypothetical protein
MSRARDILEKYYEIEEASARRTVSFRGGKRHFRYKCQPGFMKKPGTRTCVRIQAAKRIKTSRELKRAWRKRRGHMVRQKIATKRTFRKMKQSGYKPGGGRR